MALYDRIRNISNINVEEELAKCIFNVNSSLDKLTKERTCKIYNSYLLRALRDKHILARFINTLDLGLTYEHVFVLVLSNDGGFFLADMTFSQFSVQTDDFQKLYTDGYQKVSEDEFNHYLSIVENRSFQNGFSMEDVFSLPNASR